MQTGLKLAYLTLAGLLLTTLVLSELPGFCALPTDSMMSVAEALTN